MSAQSCAWCGATNQNLLVMMNGAIACEDWHACAEREKNKSDTVMTPWSPLEGFLGLKKEGPEVALLLLHLLLGLLALHGLLHRDRHPAVELCFLCLPGLTGPFFGALDGAVDELLPLDLEAVDFDAGGDPALVTLQALAVEDGVPDEADHADDERGQHGERQGDAQRPLQLRVALLRVLAGVLHFRSCPVGW